MDSHTMVDKTSVVDTIWRPEGEKDAGATDATNPGKALEMNPNPKLPGKAFHPDAACARNCG